jgi:MFS family permease
MPSRTIFREVLHPAVVVGALGYFVDIYDLFLFSIVRVTSLKDLGFSGDQLATNGLFVLNLQMAGMLLGGIVFGMLGDRMGRVVLLFSSILLYSVANIANAYVHTLGAYAIWRFIAGVGLAGELGGGITLVSEVLSKEARGYGTTMVATIGVFGAVVGGFVAGYVPWRIAFLIGGGLGILLLILRLSVAESGMFKQMKDRAGVVRGNFLTLFTNRVRFGKYLRCILIGLPTWFVIGSVSRARSKRPMRSPLPIWALRLATSPAGSSASGWVPARRSCAAFSCSPSRASRLTCWCAAKARLAFTPSSSGSASAWAIGRSS